MALFILSPIADTCIEKTLKEKKCSERVFSRKKRESTKPYKILSRCITVTTQPPAALPQRPDQAFYEPNNQSLYCQLAPAGKKHIDDFFWYFSSLCKLYSIHCTLYNVQTWVKTLVVIVAMSVFSQMMSDKRRSFTCSSIAPESGLEIFVFRKQKKEIAKLSLWINKKGNLIWGPLVWR